MFKRFFAFFGLAFALLVVIALSVPATEGHTPTLLQVAFPYMMALCVLAFALILIFALAFMVVRSQNATTKAFSEVVRNEYADRANERNHQYADRAAERNAWKEREESILLLAQNGYRLIEYGQGYEPYIARFNSNGQQLTKALPASKYGLVTEADYRVLSSN